MDAVGLDSRRLRWKWEQRRVRLRETIANREMMVRSAKGRHKMCPACRALVERSASRCSECGESLSRVRAPGVNRLLTNLLPGVTAAASLIMLVNGFWFVMMLMAAMKSGTGGFSFDLEMMVRFGSGLSEPRMLNDGSVAGGEWWRLVTPIFLHGGLLHFGFNSFMLLQLGPMVESRYGTERFWLIYLLSGVAGSAASQLPRYVITVGASGAIFGLIGLLLVYNWRFGGVFGDVKTLLIRFAIYMVILSFVFPNIDHLNHLGGFVCGGALGFLMPSRQFRDRSESLAWQVLAFAGVLLVLYCFYAVSKQFS